MRLQGICLAAAAAILVADGGSADLGVIWQIGSTDKSYKEFALAGNWRAYPESFPQDVHIQASGVIDPHKWPWIHPGPGDGWGGSRTHPFVIDFNLNTKPKGTYTLEINFTDTHNSNPPTYQVELNGVTGRLSLPAGTGNGVYDSSTGKPHSVRLPLPTSLMKSGQNTIKLTITEGSWALYDNLCLTNDQDGVIPDEQAVALKLTPTLRFIQQGGKLMQIIDAWVQCPPGTSEVELSIEGNIMPQPAKTDLLGTAAVEVPVEEVKKPTSLAVTARVHREGKTLTKTTVCEIKPVKHWTLYVQPSSHVDIGYTDFQENVIKLHNQNTALALELCRKHPDFKWNTETAWVEHNYLTLATEEQQEEFIQRARQGRIGCPAVYGNMLTGICSHESLIRDLYYAHNTARKFGIPFDMAVSSDVPTGVFTLPSVLAGSGIRYFSSGLNLTRGDSFNKLFTSPFYWQGPDGSRVLTWFAPGYGQACALGLCGSLEKAKSSIEGHLNLFNRLDYPYDAVLAFGGVSDNQPLSANLASVTQEWNARYAYPRVVLCRGPEFFQYIEGKFKSSIRTVRGDGGVYWEDGAGSSAYETGINRTAKEDLASAEKLYSLIWRIGGKFYPTKEIRTAWRDAILFDEHTWGAAGSISEPASEQTLNQWKYKAKFATNARSAASSLTYRGLHQLSQMVKAKRPSYLVFNPSSINTSGWAKVMGKNGGEKRIWAEDVPGLGYRIYPKQSVPKQEAWNELPKDNATIENNYYRLRFNPDTGALQSIWDKELNMEIVDQTSGMSVNQYLYFAGQGAGIRDTTQLKNVRLKVSRNSHALMVRMSASACNTPEITSEITLYDTVKRIDFSNTLVKDEILGKEAGYFAFPFALTTPRFFLQLPDGTMEAGRDALPGACMSWYAAQDFVAAVGDNATVYWSAINSPLLTLCDINRDTFKSPLPIDNGRLFAYVFNNYWFTNYKASQGGVLTFRFALTTAKHYDPAAAARFGERVRNPLIAVEYEEASGSSNLNCNEKGFFTASSGNVRIQAVKQSEDGKGLIVRLRELSGKKTRTSLRSSIGGFREAYLCNLVEDKMKKLDMRSGEVYLSLPPNGLATIFIH